MAQLDLQTIYLILTKVAQKEAFYTYLPTQTPGLITSNELARIYERITGRTIGSRVNWTVPLDQLNLFLSHCGLPALGKVVLQESGTRPSDQALTKIWSAQWPTFGTLKNLYKK